MRRSLACLALLLATALPLSACQQGLGDRCQLPSDCADGLTCSYNFNQDTLSSDGICQKIADGGPDMDVGQAHDAPAHDAPGMDLDGDAVSDAADLPVDGVVTPDAPVDMPADAPVDMPGDLPVDAPADMSDGGDAGDALMSDATDAGVG
jgi:hypothetical protein